MLSVTKGIEQAIRKFRVPDVTNDAPLQMGRFALLALPFLGQGGLDSGPLAVLHCPPSCTFDPP